MTFNHLTYIFKHFVKNERCLQQTKALTQLARVSDYHSEGSRFESCMQTRHLEEALTAIVKHWDYWPPG